MRTANPAEPGCSGRNGAARSPRRGSSHQGWGGDRGKGGRLRAPVCWKCPPVARCADRPDPLPTVPALKGCHGGEEERIG
ncbi:uncharacterized protein ACOB8E_008816 isoform 2-T2 [Sarcophilus harrisii]